MFVITCYGNESNLFFPGFPVWAEKQGKDPWWK